MLCRGFLVALLVSIWVCRVHAQQKPVVKFVPPENIASADGQGMFRAYCAVCHGSDAIGGGPAAGALRKRAADLTQLSRKNGGKFPEFRVTQVIQGYGVEAAHGSRDMPIWGNVFRTLGDQSTVKLRVANLTAYLESLQRK
jgi:mono/diheme cytochrome c family protein